MKNSIVIVILLCLFSSTVKGQSLRTYNFDKKEVIQKIKEEQWAKDAYENIRIKIDVYADRHTNDPEWIISRLAMYWKDGEHYTQCYLKKQNWDRGEGNAPVPTLRMPGMRTWNKYVNVPLEDRIPYNETGDMWGITKTNPELPPVLIPYKESGHMIRYNNIDILALAEEASFLYWITGKEKYGKFAADIFYTWLKGVYYMNPILDPDCSTGGPGGWEPGGICGYYDYEQIHDDMAPYVAQIYDFAYEYLKNNPDPHLQEIGKSLQEITSIVLKRFIDIGFVRGGRNGNWNVNGWNMMLRPILVLESNDAYKDGKGREYYLHYFTTETTKYHEALPDILKSYDPVTGLWPESPGYALGTVSMLLDIALMLKSNGIDIIADNPVMQKAALAVFPWIDEQCNLIVFGDSRGGSANFTMFENLLTYYTLTKDEDNIKKIAAALNMGINSGNYNRSKSNWTGLCTYVRSIPQVENIETERMSYSAHHRMITMKNYNGNNKMMALLYGGKKGYHLSANGLAMQLYGFGYALAPDAAGYESYWSADVTYHQSATGSNTIMPGYTEGEIKINAMEPMVDSLSYTNSKELNPYINFADVTAGEKRRMVATIRTSDETGYYLDLFRSNLDNNDYLYHNLGTSLSLYTKSNKELKLTSVEDLGVTYSKGYDYFANPRKISYKDDFMVHWKNDKSPISMCMWMLGAENREIYQVDAPYTTLNKALTPDEVSTPPSFTPTLVVRQNSNAWTKPFIGIFEPVKNNKKSVESVTALHTENNFIGLIVASTNGKKDYLLHSIDNQPHHLKGNLSFSGNFSLIREKEGQIEMLYLGNGSLLKKGNYTIEATNNAYVSIYKNNGTWYYSSDSEVNVVLAGKKIHLSAGYNQEITF